MSDTPACSRFCLRDLPLPAKVVITCFLLSVGLGYTAAMVQLHFQDSKSGQPMPTVEDVVLKFTGKKWFETDPPRPVSKFVKLIVAPDEGLPFNGSGSMSAAFFGKDPEYIKHVRGAGPRPELRAEREGERDVLVLWANADPTARKAAYQDDHFGIEPGKLPKAITKEFRSADGTAVKVKAIIDARCARCHGKGEPQESMPLETYAQIEKYLAVPAPVTVPPGGGWVRVEEPMSLEKLTQSTHAHLLSFSMLFSLTGLVFAFTSYCGLLRCIVGPWVLIAIVTDVCFWWLARLSEGYGQYFAMGVLGTGGAAGLGLGAQITLSLWNMYGPKGKVVIVGLFALGAATGGLVMTTVALPGLEAKKAEAEKARAEAAKKPDDDAKKPEDKKPEDKKPEVKKGTPPAPVSDLEKVLTVPKGTEDVRKLKWKGDIEGGMVLAFFDRDEGKEFVKAIKDATEAEQKQLLAERHGELAALLAWIKAADSDRKKAYDADKFDLPPDLAGRPVTAYYKAGDKAVKIKSVITDRCARCHQPGADREETLLDTFDNIKKRLEVKGGMPMGAANPTPAPEPKTVAVGPTRMQQLMLFPVKNAEGKELTAVEHSFKGNKDGGMVRAFFDRDSDKEYSSLMKDKEATEADKKALTANRHGELAAFTAWVKAAEADRKKAYDTDLFPLPPELAGKPLTDDYKAGDKAVKIKKLIESRCVWCHQAGGDREENPLDTYDGLLKYLK